MKVAYISMLDLPSRMAHAMQVMKNAQAWSKAADDFEFITNLSPLNYLRLNRDGLGPLYGLSHPFTIKAFPMQGSWRRFKLPLPAGWYHRLAAARCARRGVDLVYTRTYLTPRYTLAQGLPTIVETHAPPDDNPERQALYASLDHPQLLGLVTISQELARRYVDYGLPREKILVAPDGVDLDAFQEPLDPVRARSRLGLDPQQPLAVYVGHLYDGRGVDVILEAAARLPEVGFLLVGGHDQDVARWRARAGEMGLTNLTLTGFVPNQEVPLHLWTADVLLMPYGKGCPTVEWMSPLKMFEYMAAARPIIASDLPAVREVLDPGVNAWLCKPDDPGALALAVKTILADAPLAQRLGAEARAQVEGYSWDTRVARILEFARERL